MNLLSLNRRRLITGSALIFLLIFCSSCAYDQEYIKYTTDQINALQKTTSDLKKSTAEKIDNINSNQAEIMVEIDALKKDIKDLSGRVEDNEHLIKYNLEKDLGEQGDATTEVSELSKKIDRLEQMVNYHHRYLNLEPFKYTENANEAAAPAGDVNKSDISSTVVSGKPKDAVLYESGLDLFNNGKYDQALSSFKSFLDTYPKSDLADNAQFWIGECYMGLSQYERAIQAFQNVIKNYPKENKAPNAMYRQAIAWQKIGDSTSAKIVLNNLIKAYPESPEAADAKKKLSSMK